MATLTIDGLQRAYPRDGFALRGVSFDVPDGHLAALIGPSGAGKSSLLRLIAGLDRPDAGDVWLADRNVTRVPAHRRGIGLMFQELALFPHMNVHENVAFGLRMARWRRRARNERVTEMLELVGLGAYASRSVDQLSGGERQRVALARVLAPRPEVLLLDEPLGAIDEERKRWLRSELRDVLRAVGTTALVVSHDLRDAIAIADDVVLMSDGHVLQYGPLSLVSRFPLTAEAASMLGYVTLLQGEVEHSAVRERGVGELGIPPEAGISGLMRVMAHPSTMLAVPDGRHLGSGLSGVVVAIRPDGPVPLLDIVVGTRHLEARWEWDLDAPRIGTVVEIAVRPDTLRFYGSAPVVVPSEPAVESDERVASSNEDAGDDEDAPRRSLFGNA
ncbi:MAG: ATP-binding cassette domain-containing protein [Chloroflexi bacterium]|nr:MAG: ATP-binding cassette domain-containing protein [Chloroflexota bacterium]